MSAGLFQLRRGRAPQRPAPETRGFRCRRPARLPRSRARHDEHPRGVQGDGGGSARVPCVGQRGCALRRPKPSSPRYCTRLDGHPSIREADATTTRFARKAARMSHSTRLRHFATPRFDRSQAPKRTLVAQLDARRHNLVRFRTVGGDSCRGDAGPPGVAIST